MSFPIPGYPEKTTIADPDLLVIEDVAAGNTKHVTRENLLSSAPLPADTVDEQAILNGSVATNKLGDGAATDPKVVVGAGNRFKVGRIPASTFNSTGNKAITGVGFQPKVIEFFPTLSNNISVGQTFQGVADENEQYAHSIYSSGTSGGRNSSNSHCILGLSAGNTIGVRASLVSMDADGFTLNCSISSSAFSIVYIARA